MNVLIWLKCGLFGQGCEEEEKIILSPYILDNLIWLYFPLTPIEKSNRPIVYHVVRLPMRFKQGELKVSRHMYVETFLHAHRKPGIKTPECNEPSPVNIHVLYLTIVILKLPVPHFT
jgi:hypothetical protein